VFVVVMENRSAAEALSGPYTAQLGRTYGEALDYHAVAHPSLPNYLALTSGSTWGVTDDGYHRLPEAGLGSELTQAGVSWRAYMEGMTGTCLTSPYPYALKHDPFAYYGGACPPNVVPLTRLAADLAAPPRLVWITPGLCHDGHDCSTGVADAWLASILPAIFASAAWRDGGVLFLTWDEDDGSEANQVLTIVAASGTSHRVSQAPYSHYSLLATVCRLLGVRAPGKAGSAAVLDDLLGQTA
jgi:acid phosphatase